MKRILLYLFLFMICFSANARQTDSAWFVNQYTKTETYITMRDGVKLFTSIYSPKDNTQKHPILITRTPYSCRPYGENNFTQIWNGYKNAYVKEGYIFVTQDVRGRYMSEGDFVDVRPFIKNKKAKQIDEASDTWDTVDWLVKNIKNNNGRVGVMGTSYPGFYSTQAALSGHPAIKAVSPQAPVTDWFMGDDFHHNGAFFAMDGFAFYSVFGKPHPHPTQNYGTGFSSSIKDNYKFFLQAGSIKNLAKMIGDSIAFWHQLYQHPTYDDWWKARNARTGMYNIKPAMLWVGGLFDAEDCYGAWHSYKATEKQSAGTNSKIVMGPWYHGQWSREGSYLGHVQFGSNTSAYYQQNIEIPFFQYYLKDIGSVNEIAEANIFFTGENNWHQFTQWPPADVSFTNLYCSNQNSLHFNPEKINNNTQNEEALIYVSDPAKPVPYTEDVHHRRTREYMTDDQRFASRRPDVLVFNTEALSEDLTLSGPIQANIFTAISTTDADFVVKIIDVFPDDFQYPKTSVNNTENYPMGGYQMLVRGEIMRGKFRNSFQKPEPFVPNQKTKVSFELPDIAHTFKKGHRLMIQIQSSWFPLADRNPQTFTNIYTANENDFKPAVIKIYTGAAGTYFTLPILKN